MCFRSMKNSEEVFDRSMKNSAATQSSKTYLAPGRAPSRLRFISSICGCTTWS